MYYSIRLGGVRQYPYARLAGLLPSVRGDMRDVSPPSRLRLPSAPCVHLRLHSEARRFRFHHRPETHYTPSQFSISPSHTKLLHVALLAGHCVYRWTIRTVFYHKYDDQVLLPSFTFIVSIATVWLVFLLSLVMLESSHHGFNSSPKTSAIARTLQCEEVACEALLDATDSRMDRKRAKRQQLASKRTLIKRLQHFDIYEPEVVCFTEERFGSGERDTAFGDGPKFVCGVDFLDPKDCLVYITVSAITTKKMAVKYKVLVEIDHVHALLCFLAET